MVAVTRTSRQTEAIQKHAKQQTNSYARLRTGRQPNYAVMIAYQSFLRGSSGGGGEWVRCCGCICRRGSVTEAL